MPFENYPRQLRCRKVVALQHAVPSPELSGTIFTVNGCIKSQGMILQCGKEKCSLSSKLYDIIKVY
jgi:hypothetical protein